MNGWASEIDGGEPDIQGMILFSEQSILLFQSLCFIWANLWAMCIHLR